MHPPSETTSATSAIREVSVAAEAGAQERFDHYGTLMFLATAYIVHNEVKFPMRIFLDQGSSLYFMSTAVRRLMPQLKPVSRANLRIQAFSSLHNVQAERFKLTLRSTYGNLLMEVFAYEHDFGVHPSRMPSPCA